MTHWSVAPFGTGLSRVKNVGMLLVIRILFKFLLISTDEMKHFFLSKDFCSEAKFCASSMEVTSVLRFPRHGQSNPDKSKSSIFIKFQMDVS